MYPSSQSAASLGLHAAAAAAAAASLGGLPVSIAQQTSSIYSGATGGGLLTTAADARVTPYNWQAAIGLTNPTGGLFPDHQSGPGIVPKVPPDSADKRSPSVQRVGHHTSSSSGGIHASENSSSSATSNRFQPYRGAAAAATVATDLLAGGGSASGLSGSQFAAFDSMYKAYQGAFSQGTGAAGLFTPQSLRFEDQLLTEQQLMLQASLLQYPHFGVFPGAAAAAAAAAASSGLYPGLAAASAAGIRFPPSDYYAAAAAAQSMPPGLLLPAVKFPNASSSNWLGLDRLAGVSTATPSNDRDTKESRGDRLPSAGSVAPKESETIPRRPHDRGIPSRDKQSDHGHASSTDRDEAARRDSGARRPSDSELQQQQRQERRHSGSHHHHHHSHPSPAKDDNSSRHFRATDGLSKQAAHHSGNAMKSERQHTGSAGHGVPSEPLNLNKPMPSSDITGTPSSHQRSSGRSENNWERQFTHQQHPQDREHVKEARLPGSNRTESESVSRLDKMMPLTLTIPPRPGLSSSTPLQHEQKFHRPFELPARSDANVASNKVKTSKVASVATALESRPSMSGSDRNGDVTEIQNQHALSLTGPTGPGNIRLAPGDELPLNLVCRHGESQQKQQRTSVVEKADANMPVRQLLQSDASVRCSTSSGTVDMWRRHRTNAKTECVQRVQPVISKLDLKAAKRAERRKSGVSVNPPSSDDEEDDYDSDSSADDKRTARLLLVTSGPPLKADSSPTKRKFLEQFGLVTADIRADIEFEQRRKRRKLFRERSVSPVVVDDELQPAHSVPLSKLVVDGEHRYDPALISGPDVQLKALFLFKFGLQPTDFQLKQKINTIHCAGEPEQRRAFDAVCCHIGKVQSSRNQHTDLAPAASNHRSRHSATGFDARSSSRRVDLAHSSKQTPSNVVDGLFGNFLHLGEGRSSSTSRQYGHPSAEVEHTRDGRLFVGGSHVDGNHHAALSTALDLSNDSSADQRGVVNSFIDFSSPQSTSVCMLGLESSTPAYTAGKSSRLPDGSQIDNLTARVGFGLRTFQWPGIDAVMEAYQLHFEEQVMERQLLTEQCHRLKQRHAELSRSADSLATVMSDLLHGRQQLNDDRSRIQAAIDGLKKCLRQQR